MFVNQKAQEISYALIRIAAYVRRQELKQRFERHAFQLLEDAGADNLEQVFRTVGVIKNLINIGKSIYEVEPVNAKVLTGEIDYLGSIIKQHLGLEENAQQTEVIVTANNQSSVKDNSAESGNGNGINSAIRQSAIFERIRQSANGHSQLRDLLVAFPDVSERTMRYDLQKLCLQGLVERVGNGGPGSFYLAKNL